MKPVVIVGAGISGLSCAVILHEAGIPVQVLEASNGVGGRVRTDEVEGFLIDRGFQVYLDAYPEAGKLLDLEALDLRKFEPGALVYHGGKLSPVMDVFRRPKSILSSAFSPVGTLVDKLRVAVLRQRLLDSSLESIAARPDCTTESRLEEFGFSKKMIDVFFRSFYGGIFLERELQTSSRMFEFTFRMFTEGSATVPAKGMGEIPRQLAARLPEDAVTLRAKVTSLSGSGVTLASGEELEASQVVVATEASATEQLVAGFAEDAPGWRAVTLVSFVAERPPIDAAIIALNGTGEGLVNSVAVMDQVSPEYAPRGQSLISVTLLGAHSEEGLSKLVQSELEGWFGAEVDCWRHLRTDVISHALPQQSQVEPVGVKEYEEVLVCGDHAVSASIEGAVISGKSAADRVIERSADSKS